MSEFDDLREKITAIAARAKPLPEGPKPFGAQSLQKFCEGIPELIVGINAYLNEFKPYYLLVGCSVSGDHIIPITIYSDDDWPDLYPNLQDLTPPTQIILTFFLRDPQMDGWQDLETQIHVYFRQNEYEMHYERENDEDIHQVKGYCTYLEALEIRELRDVITNTFVTEMDKFNNE